MGVKEVGWNAVVNAGTSYPETPNLNGGSWMSINARDRLMLALDDPNDPKEVLDLINDLGDLVSIVKVGWPLFFTGGADIIRTFVRKGKQVFLDAKFADIGAPIRTLVQLAEGAGVTFLTVNTSFGTVRAAIEARSAGSQLKIFTVTLLTSMNEDDLRDLGFTGTAMEYVLAKTDKAVQVGCDGIIASGKEVAEIRGRVRKDFLIVTPGIRPGGSNHQDHKRAATPTESIAAGADYLVIGRPITKATNPRAAAESIIMEMQAAFNAR